MGRKQGDKEESCRDVGPHVDGRAASGTVTRDVPVYLRQTESFLCVADAQVRHASPIAEGDRRHQGPLADRRHPKTQRYQEYVGRQSHHGYYPSP
jgi:hypothetical protein